MQSRVLSLGGAAIGLAWLFSITGPLSAQQGPSTPTEATKIDYTKGQKFTDLFSTYTRTRFVPPAILTNSQRLGDLIVDGELHMSLADAIQLALENNLEIAVARYNLPIAETDLLRAKGGELPAVSRVPTNQTLYFPPKSGPALVVDAPVAPRVPGGF
jgi:hypothetical protein